jgi:4-carboxymuconolactone decarboxylase
MGMRLREPRVKPLEESEWSEEQKQILNPLKMGGRVFNVFTTLARDPKMMKAYVPFGAYILGGSAVPPRDREILILRIGWLCQAEYEFGQHSVIGQGAGLTSEEISRITEGPKANGWSPFDAALIQAADELHSDAFIADATWLALTQRYDEKQMIDLIMTVGSYIMVSMALNSLGVQLDEGIPGFPKQP